MRPAIYKLSFLLFIPALMLFTGCEESLTNTNTKGIPDTGSGDSTNTAFLTIVSGSETGGPVGTIHRRGIFGSSSVDLEVEPNFAIPSDIDFEYSTSGSAVEGGDYTVSPSSPATIEYVDSTTALDDLNLTLGALEEGTGGVTLTTETRSAQVSLTSATATADSVSQEIAVGRGGEDVGVSRTVLVEPSVTLTSFGLSRLSSVSPAPTQVGASSTTNLLIHNTSGIDFDVSNLAVSGSDAGEFSASFAVTDNPIEPLVFLSNGVDPFFGQLPLNDFAVVQLVFSPSSEGGKSATLQFDVENSSDNITAEYEISGTATSSGS